MESPAARTLSPRDFARVIGVSESSIKRWVDDGLIEVARTAGGHRRIPVRSAIRFIRARGMHVVRPELLGLPVSAPKAGVDLDDMNSADAVYEMLVHGDAAGIGGLLTHLYVEGASLATFFDGPLSEALKRIGTLWREGEEGVFIEHRATTICVEAISQVKMLISPPADNAPVAVGGLPADDPSVLPGLMVSTILMEAGFNSVNLGANVPVGALLHAIDAHDPAIVWLSLTTHVSPRKVAAYVQSLVSARPERAWTLWLGGARARSLTNQLADGIHLAADLTELERIEIHSTLRT